MARACLCGDFPCPFAANRSPPVGGGGALRGAPRFRASWPRIVRRRVFAPPGLVS